MIGPQPLASTSLSEGFRLADVLSPTLGVGAVDGTVGRYWVNGAGFTYMTTQGLAVMVPHGIVFDAAAGAVPSGWLPPPDSTLLFPMDAHAQAALQFSVNAERAAWHGPGSVPPGIGGLNPNIPIWSP